MKHARILLSTLAAAAFIAGVAGIQSVQAGESPEAVQTTLTQIPLLGVEGREVIIKYSDFPAGYMGGKHRHPGPVFLYIIEGTLTVETEAGLQAVNAGELYSELPETVLRLLNMSTTDPVKVVAFLIGETGKPLGIKVE